MTNSCVLRYMYALHAEYRALLRMRSASRERYDDEAFQRFSRLLLKVMGGGSRCLMFNAVPFCHQSLC